MATDKDIAIVGMSCIFPGANNIHEFWDNISNGVDSIVDAPDERVSSYHFKYNKEDIDQFYFNKGGFITPVQFDPIQHGILPVAAEGIDPDHLMSLHLVKEALKDADVFNKNISLLKCCYILGKGNFCTISTYKIAQYTYQGATLETMTKFIDPDATPEDVAKIKTEYRTQLGRYSADSAFGTMSNIVASLVSNRYNMKGPAYTIDAACASSLIAVENAIACLLSDQCDIALAGGMHLGQGSGFWSVFNIIGAASHKGEISPFNEDADGLLIGEGAGIVVLKKLDKAIADNDRIYAVIKACGSCSDGGDVSVMAPSPKGQVEAMKIAWEKAELDHKNIGYVEAHGTATLVGDKVEMESLTEFFGDNTAPPALIGSVKSNIGHPMPAAGIAGLIKTALALYHRKIPPTLHCDRPMKAMFKSRFLPSQELVDWDGKNYPLLAGVNAFGFGGINAHAVLEPYFAPNSQSGFANKRQLLKDRVISLSAKTKEELLTKLDNEDYSVSEGNYRLVIFNPAADKIEKAKSLIQKDKPWKGRLDIWFSNAPLLIDDAKVVFMFAGFDPGSEIETQSIVDYFNIPFNTIDIGKDKLEAHSINHYYRSKLIDNALKKTGLTPDINIGHSLGEWHAAGASGYITQESIEKLIGLYEPNSSMEFDVIYIAVGCGYEIIKPWIEGIPDLYLANDNCKNQILMAGRNEATEQLKKILIEKQIYFQILPFKSAFHTPLFYENELVNYYQAYRNTLEFQQGSIPLWSSTIIEKFPENKEDFYNLFERHLKETVRFRELIESLYEKESARLFVQIGVGALTGFVEDTLKGKQMSVIPTIHSHNSGLEQIRRIVALMFIEGRTINEELIGITKSENTKRGLKKITLDYPYEIVGDYSAFKEVVLKCINKNTLPNLSAFNAKDMDDPVLQEVMNNLQDIATLQDNIVEWYKSNKIGKVVLKTQSKAITQRAGKKEEKIIQFNLDDHPYLIDHVVMKQPAYRPVGESDPMVPMSMTFETLCDITKELLPYKKVLKVSSAGVFKQIQVSKPFIEKISGEWKTDDCISWTLSEFAYGDITIGDEYPVAPEEYKTEVNLGDNMIASLPDKKRIFSSYMFHGPKYQSIIEITQLTKKGGRAIIRKAEGKGALLDNCSQLLGLYCILSFENRRATFPMSVDEILFYEDYTDQEGIFEFTLLVNTVNEQGLSGDIIIKREGAVWAVVKGWYIRRQNYDKRVVTAVSNPTRFLLAFKISKNVFNYYFENNLNVSVLGFFYERYLNLEERNLYNSLYLNQARNFLISRIALKDAVRAFLQKNEAEDFIYPVEINVGHDEKGKPIIFGRDDLIGIEVSIAHKGNEAIAIASDKPVGIDIEKIEERSQDFKELTFTPLELKLLKEKDNEAEWIARFWVAKEAYGKMLGVGLQGNPKQYEVKKINGEDLIINKVVIKTSKHKNDYIIGWTE